MYAQDALEQGLMRESDIDRALERILLMRFRLGEFGSPIKPWSEVGPNVVGAAAHAKLALQAARESITLLRNDGILPLETSRSDPIAALALIGPLADSTAVWKVQAGPYGSPYC